MTSDHPVPTQVDTTPNWIFTDKLPELNEQNYLQWKITLKALLRANNCQKLLDSSFEIASVPDHTIQDTYEQSYACAIVAISRSMSQDVSSILPPDMLERRIAEIISILDQKFVNTSS